MCPAPKATVGFHLSPPGSRDESVRVGDDGRNRPLRAPRTGNQHPPHPSSAACRRRRTWPGLSHSRSPSLAGRSDRAARPNWPPRIFCDGPAGAVHYARGLSILGDGFPDELRGRARNQEGRPNVTAGVGDWAHGPGRFPHTTATESVSGLQALQKPSMMEMGADRALPEAGRCAARARGRSLPVWTRQKWDHRPGPFDSRRPYSEIGPARIRIEPVAGLLPIPPGCTAGFP
jgi:hypothetical protein